MENIVEPIKEGKLVMRKGVPTKMCSQHVHWPMDMCPFHDPEKMSKINNNYNIFVDKSFVTPHLTGQMLKVRNRRHHKELMKKHGVVEYPGYKNTKTKNGNPSKGKGKDTNWK